MVPKIFSFFFLTFSLNLTIDCVRQEDQRVVSFYISTPANTSNSIKEVKENQFHITTKGDIALECLSTFPINIIFSGIMPNEIQYTKMEWDRAKKLYRVSIGFQNSPQATGSYSCVNIHEISSNPAIKLKPPIYIFADDGRKDLFILNWKTSAADSGTRPVYMSSEETVLIPCLTFRPNVPPKLHYYDKSFVSTNLPVVPNDTFQYDASEGFIVDMTKSKYSTFECSFHSTLSFKFQIPEMNYKTNMGETKENEVIYWPSTNPISVECESIYPVEIAFEGYRKNGRYFSLKKVSTKREHSYYKQSAKTDFGQPNTDIKQLYNMTIVCKTIQTLQSTAFRKWSIVFVKPTPLKATPKAIKFNSLRKFFYCSDSSGISPTMTVINCHNLVNCESARRFDPSTSKLQTTYPYSYNNSQTLADRYLKQELDIDQNEECAVLYQDPSIKLGIVFCLLVNKDKTSQRATSFVSLQYFVDFNDKIVEEMDAQDISGVLRMPGNQIVFYRGEFINFTCEASIFIFARGLEFDLKFKNGSRLETHPNPRQATDGNDSYKIYLNETIHIWSTDVSEVECRALKWSNQELVTISRKIQVKESMQPKVFVDDYPDNETIFNITFPKTDVNKSITCRASGIPQPTIQWIRVDNLKFVAPNTSKTMTSKVGLVASTLVFVDAITLHDTVCIFVCIAKNAVGETNRTFWVTVLGNGDINTGRDKSDNYHWIFYSVGAICGLLVVILLVVVCIQRRTLKTKQTEIEKLSQVEIHHFFNGNGDLVEKYKELHEVAQYLPYKQQYEIHPSKIEIKNDVLGSGDYGMVLKGIFEKSGKKIPVAVKTVKSVSDIRHLRALLSEIKIMMYIGKHPCIIEMIGAMTKDIREGKLHVAVEFCANGNLQSYLRSCRPVFQDQIVDDEIKIAERTRIKKSPRRFLGIEEAITNAIEKRRSRNSQLPSLIQTTTLINWCYQIASGMEYLASKKVIHGDLAARNLLITDSLSVKITDFGLSRYLYEYSNYVTKEKSDPVPWRWLSIEAIQDSKFSTQSDVWAYGITLWEIFSLGETPYQSFFWGEEFVKDLVQGYRMGKPQYATNDIHNTMLECWNKAAADRPSFQDIANNFKELLERVGVFVDIMKPTKDVNVTSGGPIPEIFICEEV